MYSALIFQKASAKIDIDSATPQDALFLSYDTSSTGASTSSQEQPADSYWTWSDEYKNYYHIHEDGSCDWFQGEEASSSAAAPKKSSKGKGKGVKKNGF